MRSQQESCCGLAFTELNGLKLIWNSALSLIAREFSHIKHPVVSPSSLELKLLFLSLLLAVWNLSFRSSGSSKSFLPATSHVVIVSFHLLAEVNLKRSIMLTFTGPEKSSSEVTSAPPLWACFLRVALIPIVEVTK